MRYIDPNPKQLDFFSSPRYLLDLVAQVRTSAQYDYVDNHKAFHYGKVGSFASGFCISLQYTFVVCFIINNKFVQILNTCGVAMGILITFKSRSDKAGYPTFEAMVIGVANMVSISSSCNSMWNMHSSQL